jgi:5-methylcytosine-specific restriction protein B
LHRWLVANREPAWVADLLDLVNDELRERLGGPHLQIGPSHFMRDDLTDETLEQIWTYSVFPYIEEQLYGDEAGINEYRFGKILKRYKAQIDPAGEVEADSDDDPAPGME